MQIADAAGINELEHRLQHRLHDRVRKVIVKGDIRITPAPVTEDVIAALYAAAL